VDQPLTLILSPYDLSARSPAAMAALLLADHAVTLRPTPFEGTSRAAVADAVDASPRYLRFMESWRWTGPLWREGPVLTAHHHDAEPFEEIRRVASLVDDDPALAILRPLVESTLFHDGSAYLDAVSRDLLGGGDPGVGIPLRAGLERFAARHALPIVRCSAGSMTDKLGQSLAKPVTKIDLPLMLDAGGEDLVALRATLARELRALRKQLSGLLSGDTNSVADVVNAAREFESRFRDIAEDFEPSGEPARRAARPAMVSLTIALFPSDTTLRSASAAMIAATGQRPKPSSTSTTTTTRAPSALALGPFWALDVRVLPWDF
jgi:hypothetical protein